MREDYHRNKAFRKRGVPFKDWRDGRVDDYSGLENRVPRGTGGRIPLSAIKGVNCKLYNLHPFIHPKTYKIPLCIDATWRKTARWCALSRASQKSPSSTIIASTQEHRYGKSILDERTNIMFVIPIIRVEAYILYMAEICPVWTRVMPIIYFRARPYFFQFISSYLSNGFG